MGIINNESACVQVMSWHQTGDKPLAEPNGGLDYLLSHYSDVIMVMVASQIISLTIVYPTVYSGEDKKKKSKLRVTGLCEENSPVTGEFPAQRASNAENVSIWWNPHGWNGVCPSLSHPPGQNGRLRYFQMHFREYKVLYFYS